MFTWQYSKINLISTGYFHEQFISWFPMRTFGTYLSLCMLPPLNCIPNSLLIHHDLFFSFWRVAIACLMLATVGLTVVLLLWSQSVGVARLVRLRILSNNICR